MFPVQARMSGQLDGLNTLLKNCGWQAVQEEDGTQSDQYLLMAELEVSGRYDE